MKNLKKIVTDTEKNVLVKIFLSALKYARVARVLYPEKNTQHPTFVACPHFLLLLSVQIINVRKIKQWVLEI